VERRDEVGAVVHRQVRTGVEHRLDVAVVGRHVLAVDRVDLRAVALHERRGHVVLRVERVGGAQRDLRPARDQRPREVRGLGGDVEADADAQPGERPLAREPLADRAQHRHPRVGPRDARVAGLGEREVGDVVSGLGPRHGGRRGR
jgi:hypothetical protein